jgi:hypothetical protein
MSMPFPDLAAMMAEHQGIVRPPRNPLAPLPPRPDPDALPVEVLTTVLGRMGNEANWGAVSYGASGHRTVEDKVRAEWMKRDARADVNESLEQLTPAQRQIARAAFDGGMAEIPPDRFPAVVTLEWVHENFPSRGK